jgi:glycosyltransferase involved in cell wall biosynthesis
LTNSISVILATYNWPEALEKCLEALKNQTDQDFEIVIADDGSSRSTGELIEGIRIGFPVKITHVWQEDRGFRKTIILNKAIHEALGAYLIFLDGDCIVQPDFIQQHRSLSAPNTLITGSRILLDQRLSQRVLSSPLWSFGHLKKSIFIERFRGGLNKSLPLLIKLGNGNWRIFRRFVWRRIKGCNMAAWKKDVIAIGGFDEMLLGWGHEDADFVFRLQNHGIRRKSGSWATEVLHLYHPVKDQSNAKQNELTVRKKILEKNLISTR